MIKRIGVILSALLILFCLQPLQAQDVNNFKNQFNRHFDYASRVLSLAEAMPPEKYSWRPEEKVMSVEEVYTHIARYNFYYLESCGIAMPKFLS